MVKIYFTICSVIIFFNSVFTQETLYFNNVYNPENTYGSGKGVLQVDDFYYGIFGTWENSSYWYKLAVFKMDFLGNLIDWNLIGEDNHDYWAGSLGGTLISTNDGNLAFATHVSDAVYAHGVLIKLTLELDTLWKREYHSEFTSPRTWKVRQTTDGGYIMVGIDYPGGTYYDGLLLKADSMGIEQWRQIYGVGTIYSEYLTNVIETPDSGYLIGGMRKETEYLDHTLDAMLIKTDSLGNQQWTKYYGNPDVDDDMALVAMADDGNYLVATVYGKCVVSPETRTGQLYLLKIDNDGDTIWSKKIGPKMYHCIIKNLRETNDGNLIAAGFYYSDTISEFTLNGWMYKFSKEGDSIWMRDYYYYNNAYDDNLFYDAYPSSDNGYIAIGKARPDGGGQTNKMWIVKVDSMGCDTPGCATGTFVHEFSPYVRGWGEDLKVFPNPVNKKLKVKSLKLKVTGTKIIRIYNSQGLKVEEIKIPDRKESITINVQSWPKGIYFMQLVIDGVAVGSKKIIKN